MSYEHIDSCKKFNGKLLKKKKKLLTELKNEEISNKDYRHVQRIWNKFNIKI